MDQIFINVQRYILFIYKYFLKIINTYYSRNNDIKLKNNEYNGASQQEFYISHIYLKGNTLSEG